MIHEEEAGGIGMLIVKKYQTLPIALFLLVLDGSTIAPREFGKRGHLSAGVPPSVTCLPHRIFFSLNALHRFIASRNYDVEIGKQTGYLAKLFDLKRMMEFMLSHQFLAIGNFIHCQVYDHMIGVAYRFPLKDLIDNMFVKRYSKI